MKQKLFYLIICLFLLHISCSPNEKQSALESHSIGSSSNPMTFGLEIEPDFNNHPKLSSYYYPSSKISLEDWEKLSQNERNNLGYSLCSRGNVLIEKFELIGTPLDGEEYFSKLPKNMYCDRPGATEINGLVFQEIEDLEEFVMNFKKIFGSAGSQTHVVFNMPDKSIKGMKGYTIFESDFALMEKLNFEFNTYTRDNNKTPGTNLVSSALFPISYWRMLKLDQIIKDLDSQKLDSNIVTGKYLGLNWRTTSYPEGKFGFEIRTYDNTAEAGQLGLKFEDGPQKLIAATKRAANILKKYNSLEPFEAYNLVDIPCISNFEGYKGSLNVLSQLFKIKIKTFRSIPQADKDEAIRIAESVIANISNLDARYYEYLGLIDDPGRIRKSGRPYYFHYPNRDWSNYPLFGEIKDKDQKEKKVFDTLVTTLGYYHKTVEILSKKPTDSYSHETYKQKTNEMRINVARWAHELNLTPLMENYFEKVSEGIN